MKGVLYNSRMILPEWTTTNLILYGYLTFMALCVGPMEYYGQAMMAYSKFRPAKGIPSRTGMFLLYFFPLIALGISAREYLGSASLIQWIVFGAVGFHFIKRVLESLFLHKYSGVMGVATMMMIGFFYSLCAYMIGSLNRAPLEKMDAWFILGAALYVIGIAGNFIHHKILAEMRKDSLEYKIPAGGLFNYVVCAHYLFEIVIWLGVFLLSRHLGAFLIFLFVVGYLTARSLRTLKWYGERFPNFPATKKAIYPFIL